MYDTFIIGAGMSGLAAGIRLAYYDQNVCILERHNTIGGLNSFYRVNRRDYDVGLHAVTNYTNRNAKRGPLSRVLRQLRFKIEDFALAPQKGSRIVFPGVQLRFSNDIELLTAEVARQFPAQNDRFRKLLTQIVDYDDLDHRCGNDHRDANVRSGDRGVRDARGSGTVRRGRHSTGPAAAGA